MLLLLAVLCMVLGHVFKIKRWGLYISVYEKPDEANLLNAIALGHSINMVLPMKLLPVRFGDIVRFIWSGRKLKNGYPFSLATVIADLYIDLLTVGSMFFGLSLIGKGGEGLLRVARIYMNAFVFVIPFTALCILFRKTVKKVIRAIASIFNEKIEFYLLYLTYLCISSLKDICVHIDKKKFVIHSVFMWLSYVASYVIFAEVVQSLGFYYSTSDIFTKLFSGFNLYNIERGLIPVWGCYLLSPLVVCWIFSVIFSRKVDKSRARGGSSRYILPQMNQADRLAFLKTYYESENKDYIGSYLDINNDVMVIQDCSAGSNASTVLVMKDNGDLYYRKYAFNQDGEKLEEQIHWIEEHQTDIPLPIIASKRHVKNFVTYDMHSYANTLSFFRFVHSVPTDVSWRVLERVLDDIGNNLHGKHTREVESTALNHYITDKIEKNLRIITSENRFIKTLEQNDVVVVNGKTLHNLSYYKAMFKEDALHSIFERDKYSDIHGDLTVENIVCLPGDIRIDSSEYTGKVKPKDYYLIDPNTGNIHESPFLDYAKLLQSLHGGYEFLSTVTSVMITKNEIRYMATKSEAYSRLYENYRDYLRRKFSDEELLSIYYHEIVHWLRLMPYKIRKDERLAVVFYSGLLNVIKDVWDMQK